ncbi:MAG: LamG domain-containing protein [Candidatus Micrarchaeota archaeon]
MNTFRKSFIKKKPLGKTSAKAQSAMEYLMTYGWAILIISVVLAALFQLGVFNPMTFAPKAPPGSCQVFRPNGPGTTSFINLEGVCSGELPQYVAQFNGAGANVTIKSSSPLLTGNQATMAVWAYWNSGQHIAGSCCGSRQEILGADSSPGYEINPIIAFNDSGTDEAETWVCTTSSCWPEAKSQANSITPGKWYFLVSRYNGSSLSLWINGVQVASTGVSGNLALQGNGNYAYIASRSNTGSYFNGKVADAQIYNTSLSANEIQALYQEGIGGAPIDLQHLVAWWPLNGNANDYSGNSNNGQINNVNFVSNWYSGYTPP